MDDSLIYNQYLRNEGGFLLLKYMDLFEVQSSIQLSKKSVEFGKIIIITIDYTLSGYTITI